MVTSNSTQTPSDPNPKIEGDILPQAHHQNPGHCMASFAAINRMRQNAQVGNFGIEKLLIQCQKNNVLFNKQYI